MTRTTAIDGYEGFDSEGSLAFQIGGDDVLHLRRVSPEGAAHVISDEQHQAVNDAVLAALGLEENPTLTALRAILPYAESRAEDMLEADGEQDGCDPSAETRKAVAAVDAAKALLASLDSEDRYPNGAPKWSPNGTLLDDKGNRSIFDDVDR